MAELQKEYEEQKVILDSLFKRYTEKKQILEINKRTDIDLSEKSRLINEIMMPHVPRHHSTIPFITIFQLFQDS